MGIAIQWPLVLFTMIAGIGAGLLMSAGAAELTGKRSPKLQFIAVLASIILLIVGGCCSLLHLGSPQNVMAAVFNIFGFSGISIELILLGLCLVIAVVFAVLLKRDVPAAALKAVGTLGIIAALLLMFFCGHGYVMSSRPAWDTNLLPLAYLGTSLAGGVFTYGVTAAVLRLADEAVIDLLKKLVLIAALACAITCAAYAFATLETAPAASPVAYWGGLLVCGVLGMLALGAFSFKKLAAENAMTLLVAGLVLAIIAILAVRIVMWDTSAGFLELFDLAAVMAPVIP